MAEYWFIVGVVSHPWVTSMLVDLTSKCVEVYVSSVNIWRLDSSSQSRHLHNAQFTNVAYALYGADGPNCTHMRLTATAWFGQQSTDQDRGRAQPRFCEPEGWAWVVCKPRGLGISRLRARGLGLGHLRPSDVSYSKPTVVKCEGTFVLNRHHTSRSNVANQSVWTSTWYYFSAGQKIYIIVSGHIKILNWRYGAGFYFYFFSVSEYDDGQTILSLDRTRLKTQPTSLMRQSLEQ